ncbi:hypothetical protein J3459_009906 [Metarhizium acridum]|uniref:uncharacterized protein n=1 Tax=Metarhizium acridum TaxID=92637 RepID=UPI001C6CA65B|nr:hypothetical protein J3459_009906 [Metarhizium acridum]KAG8424826.1 hypothetical protein J3458_001587 [Metarhizium acridum]
MVTGCSVHGLLSLLHLLSLNKIAERPTGGCSIPLTTRAEKRSEYQRDPQKARQIWHSLRDDVFRIGMNYFSLTYDLISIEGFLHHAWDEFIHVAMTQPADSAELDRLVTLILEVRELGTVTRAK